jgi:hypothetical protein
MGPNCPPSVVEMLDKKELTQSRETPLSMLLIYLFGQHHHFGVHFTAPSLF